MLWFILFVGLCKAKGYLPPRSPRRGLLYLKRYSLCVLFVLRGEALFAFYPARSGYEQKLGKT
jgi:hypothetical protein